MTNKSTIVIANCSLIKYFAQYIQFFHVDHESFFFGCCKIQNYEFCFVNVWVKFYIFKKLKSQFEISIPTSLRMYNLLKW